MITDKKALNCIDTMLEYCSEQREHKGCQNCIFRKYGADRWYCNLGQFDFREVRSNYEAKRKNHGWI